MICPSCKRDMNHLEPFLRKMRERRHEVIHICVVCAAIERSKE